MLEFYPQIKSLHIFLISLSGALFALRGAAFALFGARWPRMTWLRWTSVTIDTFLLTSAAMLATILPRAMFANGWLTVKLVLVVVYVVLGVFAMREKSGRGARAAFYLAALATFAFIYGVARAHQPWGWLTSWVAD